MYTELTAEEKAKRRRKIVSYIVALCLVLALLGVALNAIFANAHEQGAASIRNTILDAAMQCAAVEGSFPPSIAYLEEHYDLRVNMDDYVVIYEVLGSNVLPSIVVVPR